MSETSIPSLRFLVKENAPGVWLVYEPGQKPITGTAVYRYANGRWRCERDGDWGPPQASSYSTRPECVHISRIRLESLPAFQAMRLLMEAL